MCVCLNDKTRTESEKVHAGGGPQGKSAGAGTENVRDFIFTFNMLLLL